MKSLSAVLFDVDGTLYHAGRLRFFLAACLAFAWIRHPFRTVQDVHILNHYRRALEWIRSNPPSDIHADFQAERVSAVTGMSLQDVRGSVERWIERMPLRLMPFCARRKLIRMIKKWHKQGVPMGVYSDYPAEKKLEKLGIRECMSAVVCSSDPEVLAYKPDPKGLQVLAAKVGQRPGGCVYLGDREDIDVRSAERAGMCGLLFNKKNLAWLDTQVKKSCEGGIFKV